MIFGMVGLLVLLFGGVAYFGLRTLLRVRSRSSDASPAAADQVRSRPFDHKGPDS